MPLGDGNKTIRMGSCVRGTNASIDPNVPAAENLQIGTLSRIEAKGTRHHAGQYSLPFEIRIEALSCFSY